MTGPGRSRPTALRPVDPGRSHGSLFHDEPTIETMNLSGLEFNAVGNHESTTA
jgi:2',3'-cyclic-nucleotide 2'-phosphodiesterase (5'-nucleotidase family)